MKLLAYPSVRIQLYQNHISDLPYVDQVKKGIDVELEQLASSIVDHLQITLIQLFSLITHMAWMNVHYIEL